MSHKDEATEASSQATNRAPSPTRGLRRIYKFFRASDRLLNSILNGLETFFSHGCGHFALQVLEPAVSGFATALLLWALDASRGNGDTSPLYEYFTKGTIEHAKPIMLTVTGLALGASWMMSGAELNMALRRLFVTPLLRLTHHVVMATIGVLWVIAIREMSFGRFTWSNCWKGVVITVYAYWVAVALHMVAEWPKSKLGKSLERRFKSVRWIATCLGAFVFLQAMVDLPRTAVVESDSHAPKVPEQRNEVPAAPASGSAAREHSR